MPEYTPPLDDMRFILSALVDAGRRDPLPGFEEATPEIIDQILGEAAKLASEVIAPTNAVGDRYGAILQSDGQVVLPDDIVSAYNRYRDGGWNGIGFDPAYSGQGLPWSLSIAIQEMWHSANMAFALCPTLNQAAVEAIERHGTPDQKSIFLPKLVRGEWTGTMNLTEPQAGSDLGAVRCRAQRRKDGTYALIGQKIFITYGDHNLSENIIHLVLARIPDAPSGAKGLSLFIVPKFIPDSMGRLTERNDVHCVHVERKLGIHGSPTCQMAFGDNGGATGFLIGEENRGLEYMFTMMNNARLCVGLQGVAIAERAYQQARRYAESRIQGRPLPSGRPGEATTVRQSGDGHSAIVNHPDIRRMLLDMRSRTSLARSLVYYTADQIDLARHLPEGEPRYRAQKRLDLLIPIVKAWCTDLGVECASLGIQIHGGAGYIEETGAAQHWRDARIAPIYEGTNGIQANDLVFRKVVKDNGSAMGAFIADIRSAAHRVQNLADPCGSVVAQRLTDALDSFDVATQWILKTAGSDMQAVAGAAGRYLEGAGLVSCGYMAALSLDVGNREGITIPADKVDLCRYFANQWLSQVPARLTAIETTGDWAGKTDLY